MEDFLSKLIFQIKNSKNDIDFYRAILSLQTFATPDEFNQLLKVVNLFPERHAEYFDKVSKHLAIGNKEIRRYKRKVIKKNAIFFSNFQHNTYTKNLIVGFSGMSNALMGPIAYVLQYFSEESFDFLLIMDPSRLGYTSTIGEYAKNFDALCEEIARINYEFKYKSIKVIGTSAGGAAAIALGKVCRSSTALCFSGRLPTASVSYGGTQGASNLRDKVALSGGHNFFCIFPELHLVDSQNARELADVSSSQLIAVNGLSDHNTLHHLHTRNELIEIFDKTNFYHD